MTKEQVLALKAMTYAYRNYGEKRLCHGEYTINPFTKDEVSIGFNKAYIICQEMIDAESEDKK